ncbi:ATP-grasp domain-containing protein [Rhodobacteraceae bacterium D3-12]|nr:ATP-grasp domain-containing protein [Rhodobacteraceae bacterium D3-12]
MKKILIANRGEIACRIGRAAHSLGWDTVAIYSDADTDSLHVEEADEAVHIGPAPAAQSYLRVDAILEAAKATGADGIHPGYGFLAENAAFARKVQEAGLMWIGPSAKSIEDMGDKERARALAQAAGVPVLPGSERLTAEDLHELDAAAAEIGFPLLVKASAGGGGIGMRRVDRPEQLAKAVNSTQEMAARSFGDGSVYLERFVARARHVEIQIFGLGDGRAFHLFERDCSTQRRFQKVIEESPAPNLDSKITARMGESARALAAAQNYSGAGTVEFIVDADSGEFYFLEMNTRIQVEHPVTEMICDVDLVAMQIRHAAGEDLEGELCAINRQGVAVECRLYAENPNKLFLPAPGTLSVFETPKDIEGVRIDTGVREGAVITPYYDPMIAKVLAWGETRKVALDRAAKALSATRIEGLMTNRDFLIAVLQDDEFSRGEVWTGYVDARRKDLIA